MWVARSARRSPSERRSSAARSDLDTSLALPRSRCVCSQRLLSALPAKIPSPRHCFVFYFSATRQIKLVGVKKINIAFVPPFCVVSTMVLACPGVHILFEYVLLSVCGGK